MACELCDRLVRMGCDLEAVQYRCWRTCARQEPTADDPDVWVDDPNRRCQ